MYVLHAHAARGVPLPSAPDAHVRRRRGRVVWPTDGPPPARLNIMYPMLFKITNDTTGTSTHCGVLEFVAEEGRAYLPRWVRR